MKDVKKILTEYYKEYDEDNRLVRDKAHTVEFITTNKYVERYLKER